MWSLFDLVDEKLSSRRALSSDKLYAGIFRPTDASVIINGHLYGKCARALYFDLSGMRNPIDDVKANWKFAFGDKFEEIFIEMMKRAGVFHSDHIRIAYPFGPNNEYQISGEMDVVAEHEGELSIVELKSIRGYTQMRKCIHGYSSAPQYKHGYTKDPMEAAPKIEHLIQVMPYQYYGQYILPEEKGIKINQSRICYLSADNMEHSEFMLTLEERGGQNIPVLYRVEQEYSSFDTREIEMYPFSIENIFQRFVYVAESMKNKVVPACDYSYDYSDEEIQERLDRGVISTNKAKKIKAGKEDGMDWQCAYCQYRDICMQMPKGRIPASALKEYANV